MSEERLEELAQAIFLVAIEDVMPEYLEQFPTPLWLHAWCISLHPEKWHTDGLFRPASQPRDLSPMRQQIRTCFTSGQGAPRYESRGLTTVIVEDALYPETMGELVSTYESAAQRMA